MLVSGSVRKGSVLFHTENATWGHFVYGEGMSFASGMTCFFSC